MGPPGRLASPGGSGEGSGAPNVVVASPRGRLPASTDAIVGRSTGGLSFSSAVASFGNGGIKKRAPRQGRSLRLPQTPTTARVVFRRAVERGHRRHTGREDYRTALLFDSPQVFVICAGADEREPTGREAGLRYSAGRAQRGRVGSLHR
jgi:hypothetical protein